MKQKVNLNIIGCQKFMDNPNLPVEIKEDILQFNGQGVLYYKNEFYLVYHDNTEIPGGIRTTIKMSPDKYRVVILREAPLKLNQTFVPGKKTTGSYGTGYGELKMEVKTLEMELGLKKDNGQVFIRYSLFLNEQYISENTLKIAWDIFTE